MRAVATLLFMLLFVDGYGQEAKIETNGLFGECNPILASSNERLLLHASPDLRSKTISIPYREGWRILFPRTKGLTRVLSVGSVQVLVPFTDRSCSEMTGIWEYLYYIGEGFAALRQGEKTCEAFIDEESETLKVISYPKVQAWIPFLYEDGTSPGWILLNDDQTETVGVEC